MADQLVAIPISEDKIDEWKAFDAEMLGPRSEEMKAAMREFGLTRTRTWLAAGPSGHLAIVLHEGPGAQDWLPAIAQAKDGHLVWMRERVSAIFGVDFSQPMPPPPEQIADFTP